MNRPKKGVVLVLGEDRFRAREAVDRLIEGDCDLSRYRGETVNGAAMLDELRTPSLFGKPTVVLVQDAKNLLEGETLAALASYAAAPVPNSLLVLQAKSLDGRLKAAKLLTGRWHTGVNLVDRLLGKELCVLAWAAETASPEQVRIICSKWAALRPEERWWLFFMTVSEAGLPEDSSRGWRQALFLALSDGEKAAERKRRPRPMQEELFSLPLFEDQE